VVPNLIGVKRESEPIRIWSAGCATGEEAYTAAMILAEALGPTAYRDRVKIYATDVDEEAIALARQAVYSTSQVNAVPQSLREKYFEPRDDEWQFSNDLRRSVIFGRHDLLQDAPISHIDLLISRNAMMYFNSEAQSRVVRRFHFALDEDGLLMLGKAETLLSHSRLFEPVEMKHRIFRKLPVADDESRIFETLGRVEPQSRPTSVEQIDHTAFEVDPLAQMIVDQDGMLVRVNHSARTLF
jgi:two-component system CheB/CheR fusion protein